MRFAPVRWISAIAFLLIVSGWVAYHIDASGLPDGQTVETIWRHTASGWEKLSAVTAHSLHPDAVVDLWKAHPHPVIIALLISLISLMALVAFSPEKRHPPKTLPYHKVIPTSGKLNLRSHAWLKSANSSEEIPAP